MALLEGGYNLLSTAAGTEAVVRVLLGERPPPLPAAEQAPCEVGMAAVAQARRCCLLGRCCRCMLSLLHARRCSRRTAAAPCCCSNAAALSIAQHYPSLHP